MGRVNFVLSHGTEIQSKLPHAAELSTSQAPDGQLANAARPPIGDWSILEILVEFVDEHILHTIDRQIVFSEDPIGSCVGKLPVLPLDRIPIVHFELAPKQENRSTIY